MPVGGAVAMVWRSRGDHQTSHLAITSRSSPIATMRGRPPEHHTQAGRGHLVSADHTSNGNPARVAFPRWAEKKKIRHGPAWAAETVPDGECYVSCGRPAQAACCTFSLSRAHRRVRRLLPSIIWRPSSFKRSRSSNVTSRLDKGRYDSRKVGGVSNR